MSEKGIVSRGSSWVFAYKIIKTKLCATIDEIAKNDNIAEIRRIVWFFSRLTIIFLYFMSFSDAAVFISKTYGAAGQPSDYYR